MGFERNGAGLFLKMRSNGVQFGRVLTLGHQDVHLGVNEYSLVLRRLGLPPSEGIPRFVDELLLGMGASSVDAMDFSDYEGAKLIHDLNRPIPAEWHEKYDLVFDGGTLEHVFHFPTAIKSCMQMLKPGGRFVSVTMPNNWCGHGFYQFSPELFYRMFCATNGFSVVEMYIATVEGCAYAVRDPEVVRSRVELCNDEPVFLLVHARRDSVCEIFAQPPQQSDYVAGWANSRTSQVGGEPARWKTFPIISQLRELRASLRQAARERSALRSRSLTNSDFYTPADLGI
jgi:SAM-dependent methyltransferase